MNQRLSLALTLFAATVVGCAKTEAPTKPAAPAAAAPASAPMAKAKAKKVEGRDAPLPIGADIVMTDVAMKNIDGHPITLAKAKGANGTLVIFTCNHCPYVKAWEARIATAGNEAQKMGFGVVAINSNDPKSFPEDGFAEMKERAEKLGLAFPYVVDATSDMARAYGASKTPEVFLFDANDKLVYYGAVDDNYREASQVENKYLEDAINAVAAGKPVPKAVTKALGCSIKLRDQA